MKKLALALSVLLLPGCYKATLNGMGGSPGTEHKQKIHALVVGLVSLNEVDASKVCGDKGVFSVMSEHTFVDSLVGGITMSIYTPVTVVVTCKA